MFLLLQSKMLISWINTGRVSSVSLHHLPPAFGCLASQRSLTGFLYHCLWCPPQVTGGIIHHLHLWLHQLKGIGRGHATASCTVLWRGAAGSTRGWGGGAGPESPEEPFLADYSLTFACLLGSLCVWQALGGCVRQRVRRHSSCRPRPWLGGTAVCVNEARATQASEAAVLEQTGAPLRLHKAPGYVNQWLNENACHYCN